MPTADQQPHILMIPVTAATGAGEYYRSLTIANGLRTRFPQARIEFILNKHSRIEHSPDFPAFYVDGSPTLNTEAVNKILEDNRPDIAIFDGAGRVAQMRHAKRLDIRTVFVSSRPGKRRMGFRWRAMRHMDHHWIAQSGFSHTLSRRERFKLAVLPSAPDIYYLSALFPEPDPETRNAVLSELGIDPAKPYVLFTPGGGGWKVSGQPAGEIFAEAARDFAQDTGTQTIALLGPQYEGPLPDYPGVITCRSLSNRKLINLMHGAHILAVGTGTIAMQALALQRPGVYALTGGSDQPARHRLIERLETGLAVETTGEALYNGVMRLHDNPALRERCLENIRALGLQNDLPVAVNAVDSLLRAKAG